MSQRIYLVGVIQGAVGEAGVAIPSAAHLVRANNQSQAIRHVVRGLFKAEVATQAQLVDLLTAGVKVEDAKDEAGE